MQNSTAAFFKKGGRWSAGQARNCVNAQHVRESLRGHAESTLAPVTKTLHMARKLLRNVNDTRIAITASAPRMIGTYYVSRIKEAKGGNFSAA